MEEKKTKYSFKVILEKYVSEILVIFIGISMSFFFDEWRENRRDEETVKKHLTFLRTNLIQDTIQLTGMVPSVVRGLPKDDSVLKINRAFVIR